MNVILEDNYFKLVDSSTLVNQLRFSIAGGNVYLITEIANEQCLDLLMKSLFDYCQHTSYRLIPLDKIAQDYFQKKLMLNVIYRL